jgi:hypothetical protein
MNSVLSYPVAANATLLSPLPVSKPKSRYTTTPTHYMAAVANAHYNSEDNSWETDTAEVVEDGRAPIVAIHCIGLPS